MSTTRQHIEKLLQSAFSALPVPVEPRSLYDPVRYVFEAGGKWLRPRLVLLSAGMCGGSVERALPAALSVEMLHNFTLIHDDIMDRADTRRGRPCVHVRWDRATAILSGDVLFALAVKQLINNGSGNGSIRMVDCFLDAVKTVCEGQALDMEFEKRERVTISDYLLMIKAKTAALIRGSMELGALFAGAGHDMVQRCGVIGEHAGLAFQIQDDLLDATADSSRFGKQIGGDIREGKKTFLSILAMERADENQRKWLEESLGNRNAGKEELLRIVNIYEELGVLEMAQSEIAKHYNKAVKELGFFGQSSYSNEIKLLLDKLRVRDK